MKSIYSACALVLGLALAAAAPLGLAQQHQAAATSGTANSAPELHKAMRALWKGHIDATRAYAVAVKANDPAGAERATNAAVSNAKDISNAVAGFYSEAGGTGILKLLGGHWAGVKAMTDAEHVGNSAGAEKAMSDLTVNAGEIAKFLAGANPNLTVDGVNGLMIMHIGDHQAQISQIMRGDEAGEANTWVHMQAHMNTLADALSDAIAKQFPDKAK